MEQVIIIEEVQTPVATEMYGRRWNIFHNQNGQQSNADILVRDTNATALVIMMIAE